jgi:hypothetical protein
MPHSADDLLRRHSRLLSERSIWESHWREVAQHVLPRSDFFMGRRVPGDKYTEKIYDATACLALERFTASMESEPDVVAGLDATGRPRRVMARLHTPDVNRRQRVNGVRDVAGAGQGVDGQRDAAH